MHSLNKRNSTPTEWRRRTLRSPLQWQFSSWIWSPLSPCWVATSPFLHTEINTFPVNFHTLSNIFLFCVTTRLHFFHILIGYWKKERCYLHERLSSLSEARCGYAAVKPFHLPIMQPLISLSTSGSNVLNWVVLFFVCLQKNKHHHTLFWNSNTEHNDSSTPNDTNTETYPCAPPTDAHWWLRQPNRTPVMMTSLCLWIITTNGRVDLVGYFQLDIETQLN